MNKKPEPNAARPSNGTAGSTNNSRDPQNAVLLHQAIEKKAYEIWLSHNREAGCEQKHWLEAEKQLQQVAGQHARANE